MSLLLLLDDPPIEDVLLTAATNLAASARWMDHMTAVVLAQTACEVLTERAIDALIVLRKVEALAPSLRDRFTSYNLSTERLRRLYVALSKDDISQAAFWPSFVRHAKRRHEVVHRGTQVSREDAAASVEAARQLIEHVREAVSLVRQGER